MSESKQSEPKFTMPVDVNFVMATFTYPHGLKDEHVKKIVEFYKKSEYCLVVKEWGKNGDNLHVHAVASDSAKNIKVCNYRRKAIKIYGNDEVTTVALKLKLVNNLKGAIQYLTKDDDIILLRGFLLTEIQRFAKESYKKRVRWCNHKSIKGLDFPFFLQDYMGRNNIRVPRTKSEYALIIKTVFNDGYHIGHLDKWHGYIYKAITNNIEDHVMCAMHFVTD